MTLLFLTFLAFLLRVQRLSFESFDVDEIDALRLASEEWGTLLKRLFQPDENGPLFFLLVRGWMELGGQSEFALRFFSLLFGVLLVPLLFLLGRRLVGAQAALIAAFLATVSSYLLYYAQMNKMYSLLVVLTVLSSYLLLRALEGQSKALWVAYLGVVAVTLYIHVFGVMVIPVHLLFLLLSGKRYATVRPWGLGSVVLLLLPYFPLGLWHLNTALHPETLQREYGGPTHLPGMMGVLLREYGARSTLWPDLIPSVLFGGLAILGFSAMIWELRRAPQAVGPLFLSAHVGLPLVLTYLLLLFDLPLFSSRYLILTLPALLLVWASGIRVLGQRSRWLALVALGAAAIINWSYLAEASWGGIRFREDWRSAVRHLEGRYQEGDALLVVHPPNQRPYDYYGQRNIPLVTAASLVPGEQGQGNLEGGAAVWGSYRRLWAVLAYYELPDLARVSGWLGRHAQITQERWFEGVLVRQYIPKQLVASGAAAPRHAVRANLGNKLLLLGYDLGPAPQDLGQPWQLRLYWEAREPMDVEYRASLRLVDSSGRLWGLSEGPLGGGFNPPAGWPIGQSVAEERELELLPGTPPDTYRLTLRVYNPKIMQDLTLIPPDPAAPEEKSLGLVQLRRPFPVDGRVLPGERFDRALAGGLRLLTAEAAPAVVKPGHLLQLTLLWKTTGELPADSFLRMELADGRGQAVGSWRATLGPEAYPPARWQLGETVAQQLEMVLPERLRNGTYRLRLNLEGADGHDRAPPLRWLLWRREAPVLATLQVQGRERSFVVPPLPRPMEVQLGEEVRFLGFEAQIPPTKEVSREQQLRLRPGQEVNLILYWQTVKEMDQSYHVFTHLVDGRGQIWGQHDGIPGDGTAPTFSWVQGEVVVDPHRFTVDPKTPPGEYLLAVGLYDLRTAGRLATTEDQDRIILAQVNVGPDGE